jgi:predicted MPP superfamily phosphohydrolase
MATEAIAITGILVVCSVGILIGDAAVSGIIAVASNITFKKAFTTGLLALFIPPLVMAYGAWIGRERPQLKEVELRLENLPESFDGYRLVQISDIHARSYANRQKSLQRIVWIINSQNPDLIAFTGDIITLEASELGPIKEILKELNAKDGIAAVVGNHDYGIYSDPSYKRPSGEILSDVIKEEKTMGWNVLMDENIKISRNQDSIAVVGVQNTSPSRHFPSKGDLCKASEGTDGIFRILLTHDPMHWESEILGQDYPLTLSGHTHAMQFSILGWCPSRYIFRQYRGLYTEGQQHLYVNIGLGETILPFRIGTRPEITLITLRKQDPSLSVENES